MRRTADIQQLWLIQAKVIFLRLTPVAQQPQNDETRHNHHRAQEEVTCETLNGAKTEVPDAAGKILEAIQNIERRPVERVHDHADEKRYENELEQNTARRVSQKTVHLVRH